MRTTTFLAAAAVSLSLVAAGCGSSDSDSESTDTGTAAATTAGTTAATTASDEPLRVTVMLAATGSSYTRAQLDGIEAAAREDGNVELTVLDGRYDPTLQFKQIQDTVAADKADGLLVGPNDGNALVPPVRAAIDAGVKVSGFEVPLGPRVDDLENQVEGLSTFAGFNVRTNMEDVITLTERACEEKGSRPCKILWLPGTLSVPQDQIRDEMVKETLGSDPAYEIVATREGGYEAEKSRVATENVLAATPDLDVVMTVGDQEARGAEQAVRQADKTGEVLIVGNGASEIGVEATKAGRWVGTAAILPYDEGFEAASGLIEALRGGTPEPLVETEGGIVDADNAGSFEPQWAG